ncbi:MAG: CBS domain-containing protein [Chloroflexi bacterium]|nr:CBS domain-containing protein [Chloroflexota bacterium]
MKVKEIMATEVVSVGPETRVNEIARLMLERQVSGVPVIDDSKAVVGIVTELDMIVRNARLHFPTYIRLLDSTFYLESPQHFGEELRRALGTTAKDIMTQNVITVGPEAEVEDVATLMVEKRVNPIPVVEDGRLVGIVSRTDLIKLLVRELGPEDKAE